MRTRFFESESLPSQAVQKNRRWCGPVFNSTNAVERPRGSDDLCWWSNDHVRSTSIRAALTRDSCGTCDGVFFGLEVAEPCQIATLAEQCRFPIRDWLVQPERNIFAN